MKKFAIIIGAMFALAALPGVALAQERGRNGDRDRGNDRAGRDGRVVVTTPAPAPKVVVPVRTPVSRVPAVEARGRHSDRFDRRLPTHHRSGYRYVPGHFEERIVSVYVPGYYRTDVVPAVYSTRRDRCGQVHQVLVKPACTVRTWVPGHYENRCEKYWVPGHMVRIR